MSEQRTSLGIVALCMAIPACGADGQQDASGSELVGLPIQAAGEAEALGTVQSLDGPIEKSCANLRPDDRGELLELGGGDYNPVPVCGVYCPAGSYAYQVSLKSLPQQGSGDDMAITGLAIACHNPSTGVWVANRGLALSQGTWGSWSTCPNTGAPVVLGQMKYDSKTSGSDDAAATDLVVACGQGLSLEFFDLDQQPGTDWGSWQGGIFGMQCPFDQAVCGLQVSAGRDGSNDNVGVDMIDFWCCDRP